MLLVFLQPASHCGPGRHLTGATPVTSLAALPSWQEVMGRVTWRPEGHWKKMDKDGRIMGRYG